MYEVEGNASPCTTQFLYYDLFHPLWIVTLSNSLEAILDSVAVGSQNFPPVQVLWGDLPQPVSREAVGDQAQLSRPGLPTLRSSAVGPADAAEGGRQAAGGTLWQGERGKMQIHRSQRIYTHVSIRTQIAVSLTSHLVCIKAILSSTAEEEKSVKMSRGKVASLSLWSN